MKKQLDSIEFDLSSQERRELWEQLANELESFYAKTESLAVSQPVDTSTVRAFLDSVSMDGSLAPRDAIQHAIAGLSQFAVHTPHPKYFGLFNPRPNFPSILADAITATLNPQLAAWSHSPFAAEVETRLIQELCSRFGYANDAAQGTFTTGGTEANLTAVLCALNDRFEKFSTDGLAGMDRKPVIYCSTEAHHSIHRAARTVGLGSQAVREIATDDSLRMDVQTLEATISRDLQDGFTPLMIVGTAGTTGTGAIDPLPKIAAMCRRFGAWFHVDAAYGGGAALSDKLKTHIEGIEESDSITFDAHKWMSVPMATSVFLTSKRDILAQTFRISTEYMPSDADELGVDDPYSHSIQWSRRFIGLKVYLSLLCFGWKGYEQVVERQSAIAMYLKQQLQSENWHIRNDSPLPIVCFSHPSIDAPNALEELLQAAYKENVGWISTYSIRGTACFRACITNYGTDETHIDEFVRQMSALRDRVGIH
ncbi:MAG: aminotransferase class V-fold PLP-dependent enzyme [Planctomycetota bacterium]